MLLNYDELEKRIKNPIFRSSDLFDLIFFEERVLVYMYFTQTEFCSLKSDDF